MVELTGCSLSLDEAKRVIYGKEQVELSPVSMERVRKSREAVERIVKEKRVVYGINTGFGKFSDVLIDADDVEELQLNLIHSHACGVGDPFPENVSSAMLLLRCNALLKGYSGVRPVIIERLVGILE